MIKWIVMVLLLVMSFGFAMYRACHLAQIVLANGERVLSAQARATNRWAGMDAE